MDGKLTQMAGRGEGQLGAKTQIQTQCPTGRTQESTTVDIQTSQGQIG